MISHSELFSASCPFPLNIQSGSKSCGSSEDILNAFTSPPTLPGPGLAHTARLPFHTFSTFLPLICPTCGAQASLPLLMFHPLRLCSKTGSRGSKVFLSSWGQTEGPTKATAAWCPGSEWGDRLGFSGTYWLRCFLHRIGLSAMAQPPFHSRAFAFTKCQGQWSFQSIPFSFLTVFIVAKFFVILTRNCSYSNFACWLLSCPWAVSALLWSYTNQPDPSFTLGLFILKDISPVLFSCLNAFSSSSYFLNDLVSRSFIISQIHSFIQ